MIKLIITADDLGIDSFINKGIIECIEGGILTCASLLLNAPYSSEGIQIAKTYPNIETGIHLSIVEGLSLRNKKSTITDEINYFDGICLIRNWKVFTKKYMLGRINFNELEDELELQIIEFLKHFKEIPFVNGTQHMHLLPKVWRVVLKLAKKYNIKAIRIPSLELPNKLWLNSRFLPLIYFNFLGNSARHSLDNGAIKVPNQVVGMQYSGKISEEIFMSILQNLKQGSVTEITMHPGFASQYLREKLPWSYSTFNWELEKETLLSEKIKNKVAQKNIQLIKFADI